MGRLKPRTWLLPDERQDVQAFPHQFVQQLVLPHHRPQRTPVGMCRKQTLLLSYKGRQVHLVDRSGWLRGQRNPIQIPTHPQPGIHLPERFARIGPDSQFHSSRPSRRTRTLSVRSNLQRRTHHPATGKRQAGNALGLSFTRAHDWSQEQRHFPKTSVEIYAQGCVR